MGKEIAQGYVFGDEGAGTPFKSIKDLEDWFSRQLRVYLRFKLDILNPNARISLNSRQFRLCYNDLAPRNIIWRNDGSFWMLDWGFAGIYSPVFEIYAFQTRSSNLYIYIFQTPGSQERKVIISYLIRKKFRLFI